MVSAFNACDKQWLTSEGCLDGLRRRYERVFGRRAYAHLFVTKAMRDWVVSNWHVECVTALASLLISSSPQLTSLGEQGKAEGAA